MEELAFRYSLDFKSAEIYQYSTAFRGDFEDLRGKKEARQEMEFSSPTTNIGPRIAHCKLDIA